jgi:hypothetical protein
LLEEDDLPSLAAFQNAGENPTIPEIGEDTIVPEIGENPIVPVIVEDQPAWTSDPKIPKKDRPWTQKFWSWRTYHHSFHGYYHQALVYTMVTTTL